MVITLSHTVELVNVIILDNSILTKSNLILNNTILYYIFSMILLYA